MIKRIINRVSSVSPPVAIIGALIVVLAVAGVALLLTRNGSHADAGAIQPNAARIDRVDGSVGIARVEEGKPLDWAEATVNTPVTVGDRIYARDDAHASFALTGRNYVRLNPRTSLDVLSLQDLRTQLALREGSALFDVGALDSGAFYEVGTPYGAVDFTEPGLYQVGIDGNSAIISVLSGLAQVVGAEGSGYISKGQVFTLVGVLAAEALASRIAPRVAGGIVDDYYRYRYPSAYDGRYQSYDTYLDDPFYYDPYRTSASYGYVPADIPGLNDLDYYGDWVNVNNYGHCWAPRVSSGWAPFRSGYWDFDDLWGPSWVSSEPWGWAPYHYGRWAFANQRWYWVPTEVRTRPTYCPAPVTFIPVADQIAWVPLAPGEVYVPRYYDTNFTPRYLATPDVVNVVTVQRTFVNFNAPGAVTVVPFRTLTRVIDPSVITTVDPGVFETSRPVLDPFAVDGIRQLAMSRRDARRSMKFERGEQEAFGRTVITSPSEASRIRSDIAQALRVEPLPEKKRNKLKVNETGEATTLRPDGLPQSQVASQQRMADLASRAQQGDRSARREMRQLMREEQQAASQQPATQQQQMKEQRKAERQQQVEAAAQQEAARQTQQQQMRQQRKAERQQQSQAAAQQEAARQAQQQRMRQQRKAERQQQSQAAAQQQEAARQAQQQQMRQQRKVERQRQPQAAPQQDQTKQQRKEQKRQQRKPPEAFVQKQQMRQFEQARSRAQQEAARQAQMSQQREQFKAQKRAEQQRSMIQQTQMAQQQREVFKAQKRAEQQRSMIQQQQSRQASMQVAQHAQAREQFKAQKQAERQRQVMQQAPPKAVGSQKSTAYLGPPVREDSKAQRKAEKAQRRQQ